SALARRAPRNFISAVYAEAAAKPAQMSTTAILIQKSGINVTITAMAIQALITINGFLASPIVSPLFMECSPVDAYVSFIADLAGPE
ncbi:MAG TPA: hypothetical protein VK445_00980, partial [Dissulfurispiraceae bacterium]|nr:hypothetical protein [Dissulfurispiraceae bacterium]